MLTVAFHNYFVTEWEGGKRWLEVTLAALGTVDTPPRCVVVGGRRDALPAWLSEASYVVTAGEHMREAAPSGKLIHRMIGGYLRRVTPGVTIHDSDSVLRAASHRRSNNRNRLHRALGRLVWEDRLLNGLHEQLSIDIWVGDFAGLREDIPQLIWYADFQHRHLPEAFASGEVAARERKWDYVAKTAHGILAISADVAQDGLSTHPEARDRVHVCGFPPLIRPDDVVLVPDTVRNKYHLPKRYFLVCNQFWQHKDHFVVLEALKLLLDSGERVPVVAFTGLPHDHRNSRHFSNLLSYLQSANIHENCRFLGVIPRSEQVALIRGAAAVIQPSRFEGRGAISEEAGMLGTQLLCSDINVHRELALPNARFFKPGAASELAQLLRQTWNPSRKSSDNILADCDSAVREYGIRFEQLLRDVISPRRE